MTPGGAQALERITAANIGRRLAIVLDGEVLMAPNIRSRISREVEISFAPGDVPKDPRELLGRLHAAIHALPPATQPASQPNGR
jgi:hypothetical protein